MPQRSPQEMQITSLKAEQATRFQTPKAAQLDTGFIGTLQKTISAQEAQENERKKKTLDLLKAQAENDAENDVIQAQADLSDARGINAVDVKSERTKWLQQKFDKRVLGTKEEFRPFIKQALEEKLTKYNRFATPYTAGQVRAAEDGIFKTRVANTLNDSIQASGDLDYLGGEGAKNVQNAIIDHGKRMGLPQEQVKANLQKGTSELFRRSIEQQAKLPGGINRAEEILNRFDPELTPEDRIKAIGFLNTAREEKNSREAISLSNMAMDKHPDSPDLQNQFIQAHAPTSKMARESIGFAKTNFEMKKKQKTMDLEKQASSVYAAVNSGKDYQSELIKIPVADRAKIAEAINKHGGKAPAVTNPAVRDLLLERFAQDPEYAKVTDLGAFVGDLSFQDMEMFRAKRERYISMDTKEQNTTQLGMDAEKDRMLKNFYEAKGIMDPEERGQANLIANIRYEQLLRENPKATRRDVRNMLYTELEDHGTSKEEESFFYGKTFGLFGNPEREVFNEGFSKMAEEDRVDPSWIAELKKRDPTMSEMQINKAISIMKANNKQVHLPYVKK